ncbi:hypothetical protein A2U01_0101253, partial [Trifolium medium]|nr:hypothetical protein [Trifolium medium]
DSVLVLSFALSLDLRWKGGFGFFVEFTFSPLLFRFLWRRLWENPGKTIAWLIRLPIPNWIGSGQSPEA